jgi:hypothetical protein
VLLCEGLASNPKTSQPAGVAAAAEGWLRTPPHIAPCRSPEWRTRPSRLSAWRRRSPCAAWRAPIKRRATPTLHRGNQQWASVTRQSPAGHLRLVLDVQCLLLFRPQVKVVLHLRRGQRLGLGRRDGL